MMKVIENKASASKLMRLKDLKNGEVAYVPSTEQTVLCIDAPDGDIYLVLQMSNQTWYHTARAEGDRWCRKLRGGDSVTVEFSNKIIFGSDK